MKTKSMNYLCLACVLCGFLMLANGCASKKQTASKQQASYQGQGASQGGPSFSQNGEAPQGLPPGPPPQGMPPAGGKGGQPPKGMPPGGMGGGSSFDAKQILAVVSASQGSLIKKDTTIVVSKTNQSAVVGFSKSKLEVRNNKISTSGNTSSQDNSSFQGLNAAILGRDESEIKTAGNTIETTGGGANAIFAYGKSVVYTDADVIHCTGDGGHGIMCSGGGTIYASRVDITTTGIHSAAVATDRGSGVITVSQGKVLTKGQDSPGLYSTGKLIVTDATIESTGSEVAVIEGSNLIRVTNSKLLCSVPKKWGVMIYQSFSGDAEGADGEFQLENSSLTYTDAESPMFFVTNSTAYIHLKNSEVNIASGILLKAASTSRWGQQGSNGGIAVISTDEQTLAGSLTADANSQIKLSLSNRSTLKGAVNSAKTAKYASVAIDASSVWEVTQDSYLTEVKARIEADQVKNIKGNNHTVYYVSSKNPDLKGKTYQLQGGGELKAI